MTFTNDLQYIAGAGTVLGATYLYSSADSGSSKAFRPPPINVTDYEKSEGRGYFDLESVGAAAKSPLRGNALSTSRPTTPVVERSHFRSKSSENLRAGKRA